ncbi:MAG: family 10 glycosylhydrolase [Cryobacterium sp.]|uniref:glycoside hydrolase family 10 protein n=1 Tax=Cryobacterium sp. TaxID=1926290 RepID=UPI00229B0912|nr:family 10 glycosylhydrolase [Cryobacterium sp.]MCY7403133.1 family 10 glycosylhydrolase [Cryobacterium sp.]
MRIRSAHITEQSIGGPRSARHGAGTGARAAALAMALAAALLVPLVTAQMGASAAPAAPPAGPRVTAADGSVQSIDAIDPSSRTTGLFALYTPGFGAQTKTNSFGGEAVLQKTETAGSYRVLDVCTAFTPCPNPGNNPIPADGVVLSASPGGTPDVRLFLRDHVRVGELVTIADLTLRTVTSPIDATDPTAATNPAAVDPGTGKCFPGCRGAEQLIVYTPAFGLATTGTNDFGFEVTVSGDRVVARGGGNRAIPADGIVLSGHGGRGAWLSSNAVLGARVDTAGGTVTVTVDADTYLYGAEQALTEARHAVTGANESCLPADLPGADTAVTEAEALLAKASAAIAAGDQDGAVAWAVAAKESASLALYRTAESLPVEGRGLWVRPTETTPEQIRASLDAIAASGFNMVFLETVWQGYTIYPSAVAAEYGIATQRPEMVGFDPLSVWVEEAHNRGIELHPWVHTFFVGVDSASDGPGPVLTAHPEWAAVEREDVGKAGPQPSSQEVGYYFIDPSMPEPRQYVKSLFEEILTDYDVDGLHLDYIRYPVSEPWETASFSYSDHARTAFAASHGVDPFSLTPADALWKTWGDWREAQVTSFVSEVRDLQVRVAPEAEISAAVFPNPADGLAKKFQNWADWVQKGYVDVLTGMSFGTTADSVAQETALMRGIVGTDNLLYTATYGPFRGSTPDVLLAQVQAVRDAGSDGAALFAYNQMSAPQARALQEGVFRTDARTPHSDLVAAARDAGDWTGRTIAAATGDCVPQKVAKDLGKRLGAADRWLRTGKPERAVTEYANAAELVRATPELQSAFAGRLLRDLATYSRWSEQIVKRG